MKSKNANVVSNQKLPSANIIKKRRFRRFINQAKFQSKNLPREKNVCRPFFRRNNLKLKALQAPTLNLLRLSRWMSIRNNYK